MRTALLAFFLCLMLAMVSCGSFSHSSVERQLSHGKAIYHRGCATTACHGVHGEGIRSANGFRDWPLVGDEFQSRNPTAQVLFDVVRSGGEASLRALTDQQVYDAIAYELSLNGVELSEILNSENAALVSSGPLAGRQYPGSLFPPPGNTRLLSTRPVPTLPLVAESTDLRIRLTQLALTSSIGNTEAPGSGSYVVVVFTLEVLADRSLVVDPKYLSLTTETGQILGPLELGLAYPVARFYPQNIQPAHGTAAYAIFALPADATIGELHYRVANGQPLIVELSPGIHHPESSGLNGISFTPTKRISLAVDPDQFADHIR
jgi:hypothetical protein